MLRQDVHLLTQTKEDGRGYLEFKVEKMIFDGAVAF